MEMRKLGSGWKCRLCGNPTLTGGTIIAGLCAKCGLNYIKASEALCLAVWDEVAA